MIRIVQIIILLFYTAYLFAQQPTQTIRGQVTDEASGIPLPFVNVHLQNTDIGTTTDDNGNFTLDNVAIGRYNIQISKYKVDDNIWRNTRYNRNYALNFLIGKEWMVGKNKSNIFSLNTRFSLQGGDRYSPVNSAQSVINEDPVFDESNAFSQQFSPAFTNHFTASYKINKNKTAHEFALKIINTTMYKEFQGFSYNSQTQSVDQRREAIFFPNLSYKIEF